MNKKVLIVGNGFDLDIGWHTKYRDFVESNYWPLKDKQPFCPLAEFLEKSTVIDRWFDLENILKEYATDDLYQKPLDSNSQDEFFFNELRQSLTDYLKQEEIKDLKKDSLAVKVLSAIAANGFFTSIYSFNYTNLHTIARKAGIHSGFRFEYVHGSLEHNSIILGIDDKANVREGYSYMRKVFSEHYTSHHIRYDLQECNEVVFFGHSLGDNDYPYFSDFFGAQSQCSERSDGKYITIFTKDNNSRIQILEQLRYMNSCETERLWNDNVFSIIMTDDPKPVLLSRFFNHLEKDSKHSPNAKLASLSF